jgi:hypothetical protein
VPRKMHNESATVFHACNTDFVLSCKNKKVVARKLGAKCKGDKICIWVPKDIVTNLVGPKILKQLQACTIYSQLKQLQAHIATRN